MIPIQDIDLMNFIEAQAIVYEVPVQTALRIADCESSFDPKAKNPKSSASGLYQFTTRTWNWLGYKDKDVFDPYWNTIAFMKNYNKHKRWWICK